MKKNHDEMRLKVIVSRESSPELYQELEAAGLKNRVERLRTLATLWLRHGASNQVPVQPRPQANTEEIHQPTPVPDISEADTKRLNEVKQQAKKRMMSEF